MLQNDITQLQSDIDNNNAQVTALNKWSSLLQASQLLNTNSGIIKRLEQRSNIVGYIAHLRQISSQYNIGINGFEYSGDQLGVNIASSSQTGQNAAYQNVVKLLREYEDSKTALFTIDTISSIAGHDSMRFAVNFLIK